MIPFQRAIPCPSGISLWWDAFSPPRNIKTSGIHLATWIAPHSNLRSTRRSLRGADTGSTVGGCCGWGGRGRAVANRETAVNESTVELRDRVTEGPPNKHKHEPRCCRTQTES